MILLSLLATPGAAEGTEGLFLIDACFEPPSERPAEGSVTEEGGFPGRMLPDPEVFRPLLADMKEPRFYAGLRSVDFYGVDLAGGGKPTMTAAVVAVGESFGLWEVRGRDGCAGLQLGFQAGVFSQFDMDAPSSDLINTDFTVGPLLTARAGR